MKTGDPLELVVSTYRGDKKPDLRSSPENEAAFGAGQRVANQFLFCLRSAQEGLAVPRLLVLALCAIQLLYGSGNDSVDRKAKFLH